MASNNLEIGKDNKCTPPLPDVKQDFDASLSDLPDSDECTLPISDIKQNISASLSNLSNRKFSINSVTEQYSPCPDVDNSASNKESKTCDPSEVKEEKGTDNGSSENERLCELSNEDSFSITFCKTENSDSSKSESSVHSQYSSNIKHELDFESVAIETQNVKENDGTCNNQLKEENKCTFGNFYDKFLDSPSEKVIAGTKNSSTLCQDRQELNTSDVTLYLPPTEESNECSVGFDYVEETEAAVPLKANCSSIYQNQLYSSNENKLTGNNLNQDPKEANELLFNGIQSGPLSSIDKKKESEPVVLSPNNVDNDFDAAHLKVCNNSSTKNSALDSDIHSSCRKQLETPCSSSELKDAKHKTGIVNTSTNESLCNLSNKRKSPSIQSRRLKLDALVENIKLLKATESKILCELSTDNQDNKCEHNTPDNYQIPEDKQDTVSDDCDDLPLLVTENTNVNNLKEDNVADDTKLTLSVVDSNVSTDSIHVESSDENQDSSTIETEELSLQTSDNKTESSGSENEVVSDDGHLDVISIGKSDHTPSSKSDSESKLDSQHKECIKGISDISNSQFLKPPVFHFDSQTDKKTYGFSDVIGNKQPVVCLGERVSKDLDPKEMSQVKKLVNTNKKPVKKIEMIRHPSRRVKRVASLNALAMVNILFGKDETPSKTQKIAEKVQSKNVISSKSLSKAKMILEAKVKCLLKKAKSTQSKDESDSETNVKVKKEKTTPKKISQIEKSLANLSLDSPPGKGAPHLKSTPNAASSTSPAKDSSSPKPSNKARSLIKTPTKGKKSPQSPKWPTKGTSSAKSPIKGSVLPRSPKKGTSPPKSPTKGLSTPKSPTKGSSPKSPTKEPSNPKSPNNRSSPQKMATKSSLTKSQTKSGSKSSNKTNSHSCIKSKDDENLENKKNKMEEKKKTKCKKLEKNEDKQVKGKNSDLSKVQKPRRKRGELLRAARTHSFPQVKVKSNIIDSNITKCVNCQQGSLWKNESESSYKHDDKNNYVGHMENGTYSSHSYGVVQSMPGSCVHCSTNGGLYNSQGPLTQGSSFIGGIMGQPGGLVSPCQTFTIGSVPVMQYHHPFGPSYPIQYQSHTTIPHCGCPTCYYYTPTASPLPHHDSCHHGAPPSYTSVRDDSGVSLSFMSNHDELEPEIDVVGGASPPHIFENKMSSPSSSKDPEIDVVGGVSPIMFDDDTTLPPPKKKRKNEGQTKKESKKKLVKAENEKEKKKIKNAKENKNKCIQKKDQVIENKNKDSETKKIRKSSSDKTTEDTKTIKKKAVIDTEDGKKSRKDKTLRQISEELKALKKKKMSQSEEKMVKKRTISKSEDDKVKTTKKLILSSSNDNKNVKSKKLSVTERKSIDDVFKDEGEPFQNKQSKKRSQSVDTKVLNDKEFSKTYPKRTRVASLTRQVSTEIIKPVPRKRSSTKSTSADKTEKVVEVKKPKKRNHNWDFQLPSEKKRIMIAGSLVEKDCYPAIKHTDGDMIYVRDVVILRSGPRKTDIPFLGKVTAFWEENDEMMMSLLWYYHPEHTDTGRQPHHLPIEIFASKHRDENSIACIDDKGYVLTYNEYCRYRAEKCRVESKFPPRPMLVPVLEDNPRVHRIPPPDVDANTVYMCRQVYDFKSKRILKNPS